MNSKKINIETPLSPKDLTEKLRKITITDFTRLHNSPPAIYYGEVTSYTFNIQNVQFGPLSSVPAIRGEIQEGVNKTIVRVDMDIQSQYKITRNMYYSTLFPIGLIVLLLSVLVLGGTDFQVHGFIFSCSFMACAVLGAVLTKSSLISTKRREIKKFSVRIDGKIIFS